MICREKQVLFVHVPKCGGTLIESGVTPGVDWHTLGEKHLSLAESIALYGRETVERCYRFAVVRNPYARVVSAFLYYHRHAFELERPRPRVVEACRVAFRAALGRAPQISFDEFVHSLGSRNRLVDWAHRDLRPAADFCRPHQGVSLHGVYRIEEMSDCLQALESRGFAAFSALKLGRVNAAPDEYDFSTYYTPKTTEVVKRLYREDFAMYYPEVTGPSFAAAATAEVAL